LKQKAFRLVFKPFIAPEVLRGEAAGAAPDACCVFAVMPAQPKAGIPMTEARNFLRGKELFIIETGFA
jgi:hypothetical protein